MIGPRALLQSQKSKSKEKSKAMSASCNIVSSSLEEAIFDVVPFSNSEDEEWILYSTQIKMPLAAMTGEVISTRSNTTNRPLVHINHLLQSQTSWQKRKLLNRLLRNRKRKSCYTQPLAKDKVEGPSEPFHFDILAQLASIPARITLNKLLKLVKTTREALADAEVFAIHVEENLLSEELESLQT